MVEKMFLIIDKSGRAEEAVVGPGGDNADCWASAPAGGLPAMDADEASGGEASNATLEIFEHQP